ncbi:MAG: NifU family protein [Myxococcaceae bacterium]
MSVNIQLEWTPNPSTLKYVVDRTLIPSGAVNFTDLQKATEQSPLAARLFGIAGVKGVMIGSQFVTVTKGESGEWDELNDAVMAALDQHLSANETIVHESALVRTVVSGTATEQKIRDVLDAEIRPAVQQDGGDVLLDRFEGGVAYLHMRGSCSGCPSSTATLKMGIETRLREVVPELVEVVSV